MQLSLRLGTLQTLRKTAIRGKVFADFLDLFLEQDFS